MAKQLLTLGIVFAALLIIPFASAQIFEKVTFQETAIIIFDQKFSESIITSIGLETIDNKEIRFSDVVLEKINNNEKNIIPNSSVCFLMLNEFSFILFSLLL